MTKQEMIERIQQLDAAYQDIDLTGYNYYLIETLLDFIESDPDVEFQEEQKKK